MCHEIKHGIIYTELFSLKPPQMKLRGSAGKLSASKLSASGGFSGFNFKSFQLLMRIKLFEKLISGKIRNTDRQKPRPTPNLSFNDKY